MDASVIRVVKALVPELAAAGASSVLVTGSQACGDAHRESDVDVLVLGVGEEYRLRRCEPHLVSISWTTPEQVRELFSAPDAAFVVPGWRTALVVYDPKNAAAELQAAAQAWTWETVGDERCNAHVAAAVTGLAEELHKLVTARELDRKWTAAVQRSLLALQLAGAMAVHHRMIYDSENRLWDLVAGRMGPAWMRAQSAALADAGQPFDESCRAALDLYCLAAHVAEGLFSAEQQEVVAHALRLAASPPPFSIAELRL